MSLRLKDLLCSTGVYPHYLGYTYTIQAVHLVNENPRRIHNISRDIYEPIANQNHTTVTNVNKNIRTVRDIFWLHGGEQLFLEKTNCISWKYQKPFPREFIGILALLTQDDE